jgi:hypothetical protein
MFYLEPRISISEKEFKFKYGEAVFNQIVSNARNVYGNTCCGCGLSPEGAFLNDKEVMLDVHIVNENEAEPLKSESVLLCRACHATQHIDKAIEAGFVELCNSSLSQKDLVIKSRDRDILFHENHGNIKYLKLSGQEYIERLRNNTLGPNMIKFVFKDSFNFGS